MDASGQKIVQIMTMMNKWDRERNARFPSVRAPIGIAGADIASYRCVAYSVRRNEMASREARAFPSLATCAWALDPRSACSAGQVLVGAARVDL